MCATQEDVPRTLVSVLGPPGGGKKRLSTNLLQHPNFAHAEMSAMLDRLKVYEPTIWHEMDLIKRAGGLVTDQHVMLALDHSLPKIISAREDATSQPTSYILLDGAPRKGPQALLIDEYRRQRNWDYLVLVVDTNTPTCHSRINNRLTEDERVDDRNPKAVAKRFAEYRANMPEVMAALQSRDIQIRWIDGHRTPEDVLAMAQECIGITAMA